MASEPGDFEPETRDDDIQLDVEDDVAVLTINRPDQLNCCSVATLYTLLEHLYDLEGRSDIGAVVITGAGDTAYSAGFDLKEIPLDDGQEAVFNHFRRVSLYWHSVLPAMVRMNKPILSAVNGMAVGGANGMIGASDLAIASEEATFTPAFMAFGVGPDSGTTYLLPKIMGVRLAKEWILTNETIDADLADEWNLVNRVVPHDEVFDETMRVAHQLTQRPTVLHHWTKQNMYLGYENGIETQTEWERQGVFAGTYTDYFWDSTRAFQEEGDPNTAAIDLPPRE